MDITPQLDASQSHISGYGDGGFTVNGQRYNGSILLFPTKIIAWDGIISTVSLAVCEIEPVDILLIGCGTVGEFITPAMRAHFKLFGITIDSMDTGAACRTFNILMSESRRVAAALMAQ